ncbi:coenzyme F420-0:L-glutamate ligase [Candidatus Lokiarchaeum ossiferum]|uniref:coenzyme F420-0:L-glutamate ligase n=1 Tax=Candidatus Lokiarchaeum ossiferum TaxID=2951803 RepID=UPI00352E304C
MKITALKTTHIIQKNEDLIKVLQETFKSNNLFPQENSVLVIAETLVATSQGKIIDLNQITEISEKAKNLAKEYTMDPRFVQIILDESDQIIGGIPKMLFTEKNGVLIANGGIDKSNSGPGDHYSPWPTKPFETARQISQKIKEIYHLTNFGIIISDSRVQPLRKGIVGVAIGVDGFNPVMDCIGKCDLYGHEMEWTQRALADQLTDAAHLVMGECDEQTPFVMIENAPVDFTNEKIAKDAMLFPREDDLFARIYKF